MKKTIKNPKKTKKEKTMFKSETDNLYISLNDVNNKRKQLLSSIKDSLIMQEETEKIKKLRSEKFSVLNEIKTNMTQINSNYQKLKKFLPNVKNVISYTEKELSELETHIQLIKKNISNQKEEISLEENISENLSGMEIKSNKISDKKVQKNISKSNKIKSIPISKIDRIKNNLKVIEAKLNNL